MAASTIRALDTSNLSTNERDRSLEELERLLDGYEVEEVNYYAGVFNTGCLLDYLPEDTLTVVIRPDDIVRAAWESDERTTELRRVKGGPGRTAKGVPLLSPDLGRDRAKAEGREVAA